MYLAYSALLAVGFLLSVPFYLWKGRGTGKYLRNFRERMGRLPATLGEPGSGPVWVHAVSVGEVLAARPLIAALAERFPGRKILLSTTTLTGQEVAAKGVRGAAGLFFAPFDFPRPVRAVLDRLRPALLVLVETEIWPNLIHEARGRGVRVALVNGRISPRSFPRYRMIRRLLRRVLGDVDLFLMQEEPHAERIRALGAPADRVRVSGNLKYDAPGSTATAEAVRHLVGSGRPVWVAGSTMPGEEELVFAAYRRLRERVPEAGLILAPRHPERFGEVAGLVQSAGLRCLRRTELQEATAWRDGEVLVLDTLGELAGVYSLATVVFVGGSLVAAGGHNILEPAMAAKPIIVGPHMENFQEIADRFRSEGALVQVGSGDELVREVASLFGDAARRQILGERARALVNASRGAVATTVDALAGLVA